MGAGKNYDLIYPLVCQVCGQDYLGRRKTSQYCSNPCKFKGSTVPISDEEVNQARDLYQSGMTWKEVESTMGISAVRRQKILAVIKSRFQFTSRRVKPNQTGENNDSWKGGRTYHSSGYVTIRTAGHPRASGGNGSYVMEHVLAMEAHIGRYLVWQGRQHPDNEIVHHINGVRDDNRLENLVLMLSREHSYLHGNQKWSRDILDVTNNIVYPNLSAAASTASLNENELATYIHFGWKRHGIIWKYATGQPVTGRILET